MYLVFDCFDQSHEHAGISLLDTGTSHALTFFPHHCYVMKQPNNHSNTSVRLNNNVSLVFPVWSSGDEAKTN